MKRKTVSSFALWGVTCRGSAKKPVGKRCVCYCVVVHMHQHQNVVLDFERSWVHECFKRWHELFLENTEEQTEAVGNAITRSLIFFQNDVTSQRRDIFFVKHSAPFTHLHDLIERLRPVSLTATRRST
uniref:Putative secreted protein n=1 Tax=Anopheles triannulatus TaxID=58253 RepID=A0A2M4B586_9DIPT